MNIYQHFRPEEREFIDQVLQWKNYVESTYTLKLTDFLDPREQHILKIVMGGHGEVKLKFFGGSPGVERKRACLMPEYLNEDEVDFQIKLCEIDYPMKFVTIEHPQVLGTLMSLGLKRGKFGDILVKEGRIQFFTAAEVSEYIKSNFVSIGRASVKLRELDLDTAISSEDLWVENVITISSLRLDTVIAGMHNLSRQKSQMFIGQGLVKVNWSVIENTSFECAEGDLISVRGQGRAKIMSIEGKTKKEKWRIQVGKQK